MDGERGGVDAAELQAGRATMLTELAERIGQLHQELDALCNGHQDPAPAAPAPPATPAPRALRAVAPAAEPVSDGRPPPPRGDPAEQAALAEVIRLALARAEQEVGEALAEAGRRIDDIRARTRELLEAALLAPAERRRIAAPAPFVAPARTPAETPARPERRSYSGAVMVEVGPFTNVVQLSEFEDALASVPGVEEVYIRTFERRQAHFELNAIRPSC